MVERPGNRGFRGACLVNLLELYLANNCGPEENYDECALRWRFEISSRIFGLIRAELLFVGILWSLLTFHIFYNLHTCSFRYL